MIYIKQVYDSLPPEIEIAIPVFLSFVLILLVIFVLSRTTNLFRGEVNKVDSSQKGIKNKVSVKVKAQNKISNNMKED